MSMFLADASKAYRMGREADARRRKKLATFCIDGEYVTTDDIADRLKVSRKVADRALRAAQREDGPVTWDKLNANVKR